MQLVCSDDCVPGLLPFDNGGPGIRLQDVTSLQVWHSLALLLRLLAMQLVCSNGHVQLVHRLVVYDPTFRSETTIPSPKGITA